MLQKRLVPYIKRANELENDNPIVAFYCRLFVVEELMKARASGDTSGDAELMDLLDKAEEAKPNLERILAEEESSTYYSQPTSLLSSKGPGKFVAFVKEFLTEVQREEVSGDELATRYYFGLLYVQVMTQFGPLTSEFQSFKARCQQRIMEIRKGVTISPARQLCIEALTAIDCGNMPKAKQLLIAAAEAIV